MDKNERKFYWRKLDDQAKVFALASNKKYSSVFRLSVLLIEDIDLVILQKSLELALEKYRAFKVKMKKGFFWYYFEENDKKPIVSLEKDYPFQKVNTKQNHDYLFKVTYFKNKINIDFSHALTDGNGGEKFLKEILYRYLEIKYEKDFECINTNLDKIILDSENAYTKNYKNNYLKENYNQKAYMISGKKLPTGIVALNHFNINLKEFKKYTKEEKSSVSMYLLAMIVYSIYESNYKLYNGKRPIKISVPINLNKYCITDTLSNFFSYIVISISFKENYEYTFEQILENIKKQFENKMKFEKFMATISADAGSTNKIFIRIVPLFLKKIAVRIGSLVFKRRSTLTFSNLGVFEIDPKYEKYIKNFFVILSPDWAERIKCGVCSFGNNLAISFGTNLKESCVEKKFKKLLEEKHIQFQIEGNGINNIN